ncbi:MAG: DUF4399 domain-containing protein [Thiobacillus sp.]
MRNANRWAVWLWLPVLLLGAAANAQSDRKHAPAGARLYLIAPAPGATLKSPVTVRFGLAGMGVAPAGITKEKTGHHHLLIDTDASKIDMRQPLPASDTIKHFGGGQTETTLELAPGRHTLQLLMGDENHVPFDPPLMSEKISITVE